MIIFLVLFFVTISRLVLTDLFRVIVLGKAKGCGFYLFTTLTQRNQMGTRLRL
jgi:hypothetical protein